MGQLVSSVYTRSWSHVRAGVVSISWIYLTGFPSALEPQQGVGGEEGINLEEIREFAKNFKIRRLSLGLTQTQVGQALTATEGPAYSQSAICR